MHSYVLSRERVQAGFPPEILVLGLQQSTCIESVAKEKVSLRQGRRGSKWLLCGSWVDVLLPAAAVLSIPPPQDATGVTVGPETVVTGDQQTSEPVARLTYTYSGHELMKCTHCWGLLANTCALVCVHTHNCTQRHTNKHTGSLSST